MECPRAELLFTRLDFLSEKFGERLRLYFVSGAGLTGGGGHHIELTSSSPDYDEWADPGRVLLHCGIFFPQINHCVSQPVWPRLIRSDWDEKVCFAPEKLKGNSPLDSFSEIDELITLSSSQHRLTGSVGI